MFHVQLRQFPHVSRAFNLSREELESRILTAWAAGTAVQLDDRRWTPDRARLTVYEGPALAPQDIGLGRGWANAMRSGQDVTAELLAATERTPGLEELKRELVAMCARRRVALPELVEITGTRYPGSRASDRLALCEQAVWELLHQRQVRMFRGQEPIGSNGWEAELLDWATWTDPESAGRVSVELAGAE